MKNYLAADFTAVLSASDYIARYRNPEQFIVFCQACPNYKNVWACPPFDFNVEQYLSGYRTALIIGTKITPLAKDTTSPIEYGRKLLTSERLRLDARLLELEQQYSGRAFYAGMCHLCPDHSCTRNHGTPCRHTGQIRPSLEACGFDIGKTAAELLDIELKWSSGAALPEYFTLVSGFFHHHPEKIKWEK